MLITMTRTLLLLLLFCCMSNAEYSANCSDNSQSSLVMKPSDDGVGGRYIITWCTKANTNVTKWKLVMRYQEKRAPERCLKYNYGMPIGDLHSSFEEMIKLDLNCTNVCFSTSLDLIFNGTCYLIQSVLYEDNKSFTPFNSLHYIINEYPKEHFTQSKAVCSTLSHGEELVVHWYLGYIPATDYTVQLCNSSALQDSQCESIGAVCGAAGAARSEVRCARAARFGCYDVVLRHRAPWTSAERLFGALHILHHRACHAPAPPAPPARARPPRAGLWLALGAAAALLLLALLLLRALRRRLDGALAQRVLGGWRVASDRTESEPVMKPAGGKEPDERIVLLYARDCEQFVRVAELLRELLAARAACPVVDLYQAGTLREAARAPAEWLQRALDAERARVVLLQSPAAACLHAARGARPAHARRVLYREPQPGDWLLTLALRRLAETGHVGLPYRKYFVAGIAGVEADVLPNLTPQRRYALPAGAELLLADVAPPAAPRAEPLAEPRAEPCAALDALRRAAEQFAAHVRDNPDYVDDLFYMRHG